MDIQIEKVGKRLYFRGNTYPVKDRLKKVGAHLERDENGKWQTWIGESKAVEAAALVAELNAVEAPTVREHPDKVRLTGKGRYKGRVYFCGAITRDGERVRLLTIPDASGSYLDFWADCTQVEELKRYQSREYRGRTKHTTLGSIARFIAREQVNREAGGEVCAACGRSGELVQDVEDGLMKHHGCCDMAP
jgi:hypothetical protein